MARQSTPRALAWPLAAALLVPITAAAQAGSISGRVTDAITGEPLPGARVTAMSGDSTVAARAQSGADGRFHLPDLGPGSHVVTAALIGYRESRETTADVSAGGTSNVDIALTPLPPQLGTVVISVSRSEELAYEAPASISVVSAAEIEETPTLTPTEHLRDAPGVDIARTGVMQSNPVPRGS